MKLDRRILSVLTAILIGLVINPHFRSLFLFGARASTNQLTMNGMKLISTEDQTNALNLGAWSLPALPDYRTTTREQELGSVLCHTNHDWHLNSERGIEPIALIENYCKTHPQDLAAHAHMLRLSINLNSLDKVAEKEKLKAQAARMAQYATQCASQEPNNWYWRERAWHFLLLLNENEKAEDIFCAQPFPTKFQDYVDDEVACKEAFYAGGYVELPRAAMMSLWAETIFPHLSGMQQVDQMIKKSAYPIKVRVADIHFGQALLTSNTSMIASLVGVRYIRRGLWDTMKYGNAKKMAKPAEEAKVEPEYLKVSDSKSWQRTKSFAREEFAIPLFMEDSDTALLYVGQFGPIFINAGIYTAVFALIGFGLARTKVRNIENPLAGWSVLFIGMLIPNLFLDSAQYLSLFSLSNSYLVVPFIALAIWSLLVLCKADGLGKRHWLVFPLLLAVLTGLLSPGCQATMMFFFIAIIAQKGRMPLSPWVSAIGMFILSYQAAINQPFVQSGQTIFWALLFGMAALLAVSRRKPEPDQPRLASLAFTAGAIIIGTFLTAQYDRGVSTYFESQKEIQTKLKTKIEGLQLS